jgi:predicted O-methyltransferase YrrM
MSSYDWTHYAFGDDLVKDRYQQFYDNWEVLIQNDQELAQFSKEVGEIKDTVVPDNYMELWNKINLPIQVQKANNYRLTEEHALKCFEGLHKRAFYLVKVAKFFNAKNILEVGTSQGWQYFSFAEYAKGVKGHVWSCDIRDVRHQESIEKYDNNTTFHYGRSETLKDIVGDNKIDMFYIDGAHDKLSVLRDVYNLQDVQADECVWVFDDFDHRFGCFDDIEKLCTYYNRCKVYNVGEAASGNPSHQAIIFGKIDIRTDNR